MNKVILIGRMVKDAELRYIALAPPPLAYISAPVAVDPLAATSLT